MKRFSSRLVLGPVLVLIVAALAFGVVIATRGGSSHRACVAEVTLPAWAHDVVMAVAKGLGEPKPTGQWAVTSPHAAAQAVEGFVSFTKSVWETHTPVYVIVLHGSFVDANPFGPHGVAPIKGTTMVLVLDPATQGVATSVLGPHPPDVSGVGQMYDFTP
jgi:hypothetical protein